MSSLSVDHLIGIKNLQREDIELIYRTAENFKEVINRPIKKVPSLREITIANLFFENSTRTKLSFELAEKRLSADVINSLGTVFVHGVAVRPGHPVILGIVERTADNGRRTAVPVIGVPGYPVSAAMTGEIFVKPLLARWLGHQPESPVEIEATLTRKMVSPSGDDDYVRMAVGRVGERVLAAPLTRGAGVISSLVRADGIAVIIG